MKLSLNKKLVKSTKVSIAKKLLDFKECRRSFESLDSQNYGSWPIAVKITLLLSIIGGVGALAWTLPISSKIDQIKAAEAQETMLLQVYREKESTARQLTAYKIQITQMELEFKALLDQLPKETRVSELVEGINMTGVSSNIRFQDISIEPEIEQALFIEQPIRITALGDYHQFGIFVSGLAALSQIITLQDFEVSNLQPSLDTLPQLTLVLNTTTYRYQEAASEVAIQEAMTSAEAN